ncbi:MAG: hypothetical protein PVI33_03310 [Candidatus Omnitrophota bacterium]|jgi:hypothetical protein
MSVLNRVRKYSRFCTGMGRFLKQPLSLETSRQIISNQLKTREEQFLNIVRKAIFENNRSPYLRLLKLAGYNFEDIKNLVVSNGIERSLGILADKGVYITFDEFKGYAKVVRNGSSFDFKESDFDNPFLSSYFDVHSGGTRSPGTRTMIDFDFLLQEAAQRAAVLDVYGLLQAPCILWFPILPGNAGVMNIFRQAKIGPAPIKWFSQVDKRTIRPSIQDQLGTAFMVYMGRFFGSNIPKPEYIDLKEADKIAEYLAAVINKFSQCSVWTYVNSAIRICIAANQRRINLKGVSFFISGEPITDIKLEEIASSGARAIPYFAFVEGGITAFGCANRHAPDDMHFLSNRMAVITRKKQLKDTHNAVDSLLFTSLLPESPKILLNTETGDEAVLSSRKCGCGLEKAGLSSHIQDIHSFEKFTCEGMTFMVSDFRRIAEEILPRKYGGSSTDYQIQEEYDPSGITFINIIVSPRVGQVNDTQLIKTVIQELGKAKSAARLMAQVWARADTIRIQHIEPIPTKRGKILSFTQKKVAL